MFKEIKVHNIHGARVVLYPMESVGIVVTKATFKFGSWYEQGPRWGAAHLLEHIVHHGTAEFKTRQEIAEFVEENGIYNNAATSGNSMWFDINFPEVSVKEGLHLLEELIFHPTIPEDSLVTEKNIIRQEYRDRYSQPDSRFWKARQQFLYANDHLYSRDAIGDPDFVSSVSREELLKLHRQFFTTKNLVISVAGNFREKEILTELDSILKSKPDHEVSRFSEKSFASKGNYLFHKEDVERVAVHLTYFIPGRLKMSLRDRALLGLGSYILGGTSRSLLYTRLRHELGLVYGAGCGSSSSEYNGEFAMTASTSLENAQKAVSEMKLVFQKFMNEGVSAEAFARAKKYTKLRTILSYDSPQRISEIISSSVFWEDRVVSPDEAIKIIDESTQEEVLSIVNKYVSGEPILTTMSKQEVFTPEVK